MVESQGKASRPRADGKVVTVANEKGGVAKTTSVLHLAVGLARRGRRVLVMDFDPQDCVRKFLGMPAVPAARALPAVILGQCSWDEAMLPVPVQGGGFWVVPAGPEMMTLSVTISSLAANPETENAAIQILRSAFESSGLRSLFDVALLDTGPTIGPLLGAALVGADGVVVPFLPEMIPYEQTANTLEHIKRFRSNGLNPRLEIIGIQPTRVDRLAEHQEVMATAKAEWREHRIFAPVPSSAALGVRLTTGRLDGVSGVTPTLAAALAAYEEVVEAIEQWRTRESGRSEH